MPFAGLSHHDQQRLKEIGQNWSFDVPHAISEVQQIYEKALAEQDRSGIRQVLRDVAYGEHPRQILDAFLPRALAPNRVAAIFVHGGAFVRGSKRVNESMYDNVGYWFARQGIPLFNIEYRLATDSPYPSGSVDIGLATGKVAGILRDEFRLEHPDIFLIGHSAGGAHVASYCAAPELQQQFNPMIRGAVLLSARVKADLLPDNPNAYAVRQYYGGSQEALDKGSSLNHVEHFSVPTFIGISEYENPYLDIYGAQLFLEKLKLHHRPLRLLQMKGHNHISIVAHFNTPEDDLGREIIAFMTEVCSISNDSGVAPQSTRPSK